MAAAVVTTIYPPIYPSTPPPPATAPAAQGGNHIIINNHPTLSLLSIQRRELPKDCVKQVHLLQAFYAAIGGRSPVLSAFSGTNRDPSVGSGSDEKAFASVISEGLCGLFVRLSKGDFYPHKPTHHQSHNNNNNIHSNNFGSKAGPGPAPAPRPTSSTTTSTSSGYPLTTVPSYTSKDASRDVHDHLLVTNGQRLEFLTRAEQLVASKSDYSNVGYTLFQPVLWSIRYLRGCIAR